MSKRSAALVGLALAWGPLALAQAQESQGPPPIIAIAREEIKPGKMSPHEKANQAFASAVAKTNSPSHWIALVPVSGDDNAALFLQAYRSFAEVEAVRKQDEEIFATAAVKAEVDPIDKLTAEMHSSQKTAYARYRADLSFAPVGREDVARSRYFSIQTVRVKPGRGPDYVEYVKALNAAREKAKSPAHFATYRVATGAPEGTFLVFRALKSLKELDDDMAGMSDREKAMVEAAGGEEAARKLRLTAAEVIDSSESAIYAMNPKMSRPDAEFAKFDVAFWNPPKAAVETKALASKKETTAKLPDKKE